MRNMDVMKCLTEKVKSEYDLKEVRELRSHLGIWEKAFQAEGRVRGVTGMFQEVRNGGVEEDEVKEGRLE